MMHRRATPIFVLVLLVVVGALSIRDTPPRREYHPVMGIGAAIGTGATKALNLPTSISGAIANQGMAAMGPAPEPYAPEPYDPGPGGYTISGYAPAPAYDVYSDPSFLAFTAALDQAQAAAGADRVRRIADADRQVSTYKPRIAEAGIEQRRRINGSHETRGMFRSGRRLQDVALQQRSEGQQVSDLEAGAARAKSDAETNYNAALADLARQRADRVLELQASRAGV